MVKSSDPPLAYFGMDAEKKKQNKITKHINIQISYINNTPPHTHPHTETLKHKSKPFSRYPARRCFIFNKKKASVGYVIFIHNICRYVN